MGSDHDCKTCGAKDARLAAVACQMQRLLEQQGLLVEAGQQVQRIPRLRQLNCVHHALPRLLVAVHRCRRQVAQPLADCGVGTAWGGEGAGGCGWRQQAETERIWKLAVAATGAVFR